MDYNRVVKDLNGHTPEDFLAKLKSDAKLEIDTEALANVAVGADDEGEAAE